MFFGRISFFLLPFSPLIASISPSCASSITIRVKHFFRLALNSFVYKTKLIFIRLINSIFYFIYAFDSRARELALWQRLSFFIRHLTCDIFSPPWRKIHSRWETFGVGNKYSRLPSLSDSMLHKQRHLMKKFSEIISPFFSSLVFLCVGFEPFARARRDNERQR